MHARIEKREVVGPHIALANAVEDGEQGLVLLAEDLAELDQRRAGALAQRADGKEERAAVGRLQVLGDLRVVDDGRELVQVAEQRQPQAAEGLARAPAVDPERLVDGPHQVRAHHGDLVDDEEFQAPHQAPVAAAADVVGPDQPRRKAEERVDGLAADVDRGEPGGGQDHHLVGDQVLERGQQRRLAGAGTAGDEQMALALLEVGIGGQMLSRRLDAGRPLPALAGQCVRDRDGGVGHVGIAFGAQMTSATT